jgi:penicillin-binding protein 1B
MSQYNRVMASRRQPGSVFKPFVYLSAFDYAAREGRTDLTPATITLDEPATFDPGTGELWEPHNYGEEYEGEITWRRALAMSRNLGTIHVGEAVGFDTVASFWRRLGIGTPPRGFPSITLGVFELTPFEWPPPTRCSRTTAACGRSTASSASTRRASRSRRPRTS